MSGRTSKYPFTPSQWQELEHQALIYNYMVSGVPVPPDLIHPMRRSFLLESTTFISPSLALPPQSSRWGCFQLGFGRKPDDPEPGRCRRTDGKKWRCSKEAHPDSNYCERHMHRGKNRSRKPVEMSLAAAGPRATPASIANSSTSSSLPTSLYPPPSFSISTPEAYHRFVYPYSPVRRPQHAAPTYFQLDRESYSSSDKDCRYSSAVKDIDAYCFPSQAAGGERGILQFRPLEMNTLEQNIYSHCTTDLRKERQQEKQQQQHCFVLGEDFKLEKPTKVVDTEQETRPFRHFIDEWPQANKSSWTTSMEGEHSNLSFTKTQLSISTPMMKISKVRSSCSD